MGLGLFMGLGLLVTSALSERVVKLEEITPA